MNKENSTIKCQAFRSTEAVCLLIGLVVIWGALGVSAARSLRSMDLIAALIGCTGPFIAALCFRGERHRNGSDAVGLGLIGGAVLAACTFAVLHIVQQSDCGEYLRLGRELYLHGIYEDRGMYAWRPPGMALALGLLLRLHLPPNTCVWILNAAAVIPIWLIVRRARSWKVSTAGFITIAGLVALVIFPFFTVASSELPACGLVILSLLAVPQGVEELRTLSFKRCVVGGALVGIAVLFRPHILITVPIMAWALVRCYPGFHKIGITRALALVLTCAAVILLWTARNAVVLHALVPVSTNGGEVFYSANGGAALELQGRYNLDLYENLRQREPNEVKRNALGFKLGMQNIAANPGIFLESIQYRIYAILGDSSTWPSDLIVSGQDQVSHKKRLYFALRFGGLIAFWLAYTLISYSMKLRIAYQNIQTGRIIPWPCWCLIGMFTVSLLFESCARYSASLIPYALAIGVITLPLCKGRGNEQ